MVSYISVAMVLVAVSAFARRPRADETAVLGIIARTSLHHRHPAA